MSYFLTSSYASSTTEYAGFSSQVIAIEDFSKYPVGPISTFNQGFNWSGSGVGISCSIVQVLDDYGTVTNQLRLFSGSCYTRMLPWGQNWRKIAICYLVGVPDVVGVNTSSVNLYSDLSPFGSSELGISNGLVEPWNNTTSIGGYALWSDLQNAASGSRVLQRKMVVSINESRSYYNASAGKVVRYQKSGSGAISIGAATSITNLMIQSNAYSAIDNVTRSLVSPVITLHQKPSSAKILATNALNTFNSWINYPENTLRLIPFNLSNMVNLLLEYGNYDLVGIAAMGQMYVNESIPTLATAITDYEGIYPLNAVQVSQYGQWTLDPNVLPTITSSLDIRAIIVCRYI